MSAEFTQNGRDALGRFAAGNPGGPGNPGAGRVVALRAALLSAIDSETMQRIVKKLAAMAEAGDIEAARLLFDRVFGRPAQAVAVADVSPGDAPFGSLPPEVRRERIRAIAARFNVDLDEPAQVIETDDWYGTKASIAARVGIEIATDERPEPARDAEGMQLPQSNPPTLNAAP